MILVPFAFVRWSGIDDSEYRWMMEERAMVSLPLHQERSACAGPATWPGQPRCLPIFGDAVPLRRSNQMSPYRTVNYLAYRVSVSTSAARAYAQEARALADEASELDIGGGPDHHDLLVPEIQAQAARAGAAATRAEEALDRCWAIARKDARGPVIRV